MKSDGFGSLFKNHLLKPFKNTFLERLLKSSLSLFGGIGFTMLAKKLVPLNHLTIMKSTRMINKVLKLKGPDIPWISFTSIGNQYVVVQFKSKNTPPLTILIWDIKIKLGRPILNKPYTYGKSISGCVI